MAQFPPWQPKASDSGSGKADQAVHSTVLPELTQDNDPTPLFKKNQECLLNMYVFSILWWGTDWSKHRNT